MSQQHPKTLNLFSTNKMILSKQQQKIVAYKTALTQSDLYKHIFLFTSHNLLINFILLLLCIIIRLYLRSLSSYRNINTQYKQQQSQIMIQNSDNSSTISNTLRIILLSIQLFFYIVAAVYCARKCYKSWFRDSDFIWYFYPTVLLYILWEIGLQVYQLVEIIIEQSQSEINLNINLVIAINIFCMITDIYIITMLSLYWKRIQNQFRSQARDSFLQEDPILAKRYVIVILWTVIYLGFFIYLNVTGISSQDMQNNDYKQILLYYVSQCVTIIILLCMTVLQTRRGLILLQTLEKYQSLISFPMNKTRFLFIFLMTSVFNVARMLYLIGVTVYYAVQDNQTITTIWLELYIFTFSAIVPISFYLFGFKVKENNQNMQNQSTIPASEASPSKIANKLVWATENSKSKGSQTSSYHQTQLAQSF